MGRRPCRSCVDPLACLPAVWPSAALGKDAGLSQQMLGEDWTGGRSWERAAALGNTWNALLGRSKLDFGFRCLASLGDRCSRNRGVRLMQRDTLTGRSQAVLT